MAKRIAVLMKLRADVTPAEVKELCDLLRRVGEPTWLRNRGYETYTNPVLGDKRTRPAPHKDSDKTNEEIIERYDDRYGDPSFYIA